MAGNSIRTPSGNESLVPREISQATSVSKPTNSGTPPFTPGSEKNLNSTVTPSAKRSIFDPQPGAKRLEWDSDDEFGEHTRFVSTGGTMSNRNDSPSPPSSRSKGDDRSNKRSRYGNSSKLKAIIDVPRVPAGGHIKPVDNSDQVAHFVWIGAVERQRLKAEYFQAISDIETANLQEILK